MEEQNLRNNLKNILKAKASDSSTYRKALLIYDSILDSTSSIPNFETLHANSNSNFALFVFGSVYKLLQKNDPIRQQNFDSMLLLINNTLPHLNIALLKQNNLLKGLQTNVYTLLYSNIEKTPLIIRLGISVLYSTFVNADNISKDKQSINILYTMFDSAVESHRTNILSKETGKMLCHLVQNDSSISKLLSTHVTLSMQKWGNAQLFLNNVREVIMQFELKLVNDIVHRIVSNLNEYGGENDEQDENYLTQTYFFLQKMVPKLNSSILEGICEQLMHNLPSLSKSDKIIFCYLQALHASFESLVPLNEKKANRFLASIISIFQEFMVKGGKIEKHSSNLLKSLMGNCIRKSLWMKADDFFDFEIDLQEKTHSFGKVICMMKEMVSSRFANKKEIAKIFSNFFDSLDKSALEQTSELIHEIILSKDDFDHVSFRKIVHAIFGSMSIQQVCKIYPISVSGDISDPSFQSKNNLWIVSCCEKYEGEEDFNTFISCFLPNLVACTVYTQNEQLHPARRDAYKAIHDMFWRCLKIFCRKVTHLHSFEDLVKIIKEAIPLVSDSTLEHIAMALQVLCLSLYQQEYSCEWAGKLIAELAKKLQLEKNNAKQILKAMKFLSTISDRQGYLNARFDENIRNLLSKKGGLDTQKKLAKYNKNLEVLIAITNGIDFSDPTVISYNLSHYSREELAKLLIEQLIQESGHFQKKAYKYMLQIVALLGRNQIAEIIEILENHEHKILPASKHYRLAILKFLWNQINGNEEQIEDTLDFIRKYLPEILIALREPNQRARKEATTLFDLFCQKIIELDLLNSFLETICVGLTSESVEMKVATLNGLSFIWSKHILVEADFALGMLEIVLMLLHERRGQLYKAILEYCRRFVFTLEKSRQVQILPKIISELFTADEGSKSEHRSVLKHFLLKLTKRHSREEIQKMIPASDRKMLSNAVKTENRERRKKKKLRMMRRAEDTKKSEKESEDESADQSHHENAEEGNKMDAEENEDLAQLDNKNNLLLKYDLDKENFHFEQEKLNIRLHKRQVNKEKGQVTDGVSFAENGMMVVKDEPFRQRISKEEMEEEGQEKKEDNTYLNMKKKKKLNEVHMVKESGESFRSKRAGGDVRTKDKPEPYAFIQFNSKALNKRFKKRAEKVFDNIFEKKEGGLKGIKSKIASKVH